MEDNFGYFLAAYIIVIVVLFTYIFRISLIQRKLSQELDTLKKELENRK
jgi:CcmD family protein